MTSASDKADQILWDALQLASAARALLPDQRDAGTLLSLAALDVQENPTTVGTLVDAVGTPGGPVAYLTPADVHVERGFAQAV